MPQSANDPCSAIEECEYIVASIIQELYKTAPRKFTLEILTSYETDLHNVLTELWNTTEDCIPSKYAVLDSVNQAYGELGLAIERKVNKSADREFNKCLRNCRLRLEDAIQMWNVQDG